MKARISRWQTRFAIACAIAFSCARVDAASVCADFTRVARADRALYRIAQDFVLRRKMIDGHRMVSERAVFTAWFASGCVAPRPEITGQESVIAWIEAFAQSRGITGMTVPPGSTTTPRLRRLDLNGPLDPARLYDAFEEIYRASFPMPEHAADREAAIAESAHALWRLQFLTENALSSQTGSLGVTASPATYRAHARAILQRTGPGLALAASTGFTFLFWDSFTFGDLHAHLPILFDYRFLRWRAPHLGETHEPDEAALIERYGPAARWHYNYQMAKRASNWAVLAAAAASLGHTGWLALFPSAELPRDFARADFLARAVGDWVRAYGELTGEAPSAEAVDEMRETFSALRDEQLAAHVLRDAPLPAK